MTIIKSAQSASHKLHAYSFGNEHSTSPSYSETALDLNPIRHSGEIPATPRTKSPDAPRRIEQLEKALREAKEQAESDCKASFEKGLKAGRAEAETKDAERLADLRTSLDKARDCISEYVENQLALSVKIARTALGRVLGDETQYAAYVADTMRLWKTRLAGTAILRVRVSATDFADESAFQTIAEQFEQIDIEAESDLAPGSCLFELQLGQLDASIPLQLKAADTFLADFSMDRAA